MNKTKIDWADYSWNPVVGCKNGCWYCYAKKIRKRFNPDIPFEEITCYPEKFEEPFRITRPSKIFAGSMTDLFSDWMPRAYAKKMIEIASKCSQHTFMFLTKNPQNYLKLFFPKNCWLGATITGKESSERQLFIYEVLSRLNKNIRFVSYEPLLDCPDIPLTGYLNVLKYQYLDWIIIGGLSGCRYSYEKEWVEAIIYLASRFKVPIFIKDNLNWLEVIQDYPNPKKRLESVDRTIR